MKKIIVLLTLAFSFTAAADRFDDQLAKQYPFLFIKGKPAVELAWNSTNVQTLAPVFALDVWNVYDLEKVYRTALQKKYYRKSAEYPQMVAALKRLYLTIRKIRWVIPVNVSNKCVYDLKRKVLIVDINQGSQYYLRKLKNRQLVRQDYSTSRHRNYYLCMPFKWKGQYRNSIIIEYPCTELQALKLEKATTAEVVIQLVSPDIAVNGRIRLYTNTFAADNNNDDSDTIAQTNAWKPLVNFVPSGTLTDDPGIIWRLEGGDSQNAHTNEIPLNKPGMPGYAYESHHWVKQFYRNGKANGKYWKYTNDKNMLVEWGIKKDGLLHGRITRKRNNNGIAVTSVIFYHNGKRHGRFFTRSAKGSMTGQYRNDKPYGWFFLKDRWGKLMLKILIKADGSGLLYRYKNGRYIGREKASEWEIRTILNRVN